jgi:hypothetical protein
MYNGKGLKLVEEIKIAVNSQKNYKREYVNRNTRGW